MFEDYQWVMVANPDDPDYMEQGWVFLKDGNSYLLAGPIVGWFFEDELVAVKVED